MPEGRFSSVEVSDLIAAGALRVEDGNHGEYRPRHDEFTHEGVSYIRAADIQGNTVIFNNSEKINNVAFMRIRKGIGAPNDVLLTHKGTVGKVALVGPDAPRFVCSPQTTFWRSQKKCVVDPRFLFYTLQSEEFQNQLLSRRGESDMAPYVSLTEQRKLQIRLTSLENQVAISSVLSALDEKITINHLLAGTARDLAVQNFLAAIEFDSTCREISSVAQLVSRGVTPHYSKDLEDVVVVNQKCIRNQRVDFRPARRTIAKKVPPQKYLQRNDVLVNSTGVGTLGRVALWPLDFPCTVDSHVTIVRFDPDKVDPICAGFAMLCAQDEFEILGEGSTGQTELSRANLGSVSLDLPSPLEVMKLRPRLDALEVRAGKALAESLILAELRDTLLSKLMSGELRVRDAEKVVEEAT